MDFKREEIYILQKNIYPGFSSTSYDFTQYLFTQYFL